MEVWFCYTSYNEIKLYLYCLLLTPLYNEIMISLCNFSHTKMHYEIMISLHNKRFENCAPQKVHKIFTPIMLWNHDSIIVFGDEKFWNFEIIRANNKTHWGNSNSKELSSLADARCTQQILLMEKNTPGYFFKWNVQRVPISSSLSLLCTQRLPISPSLTWLLFLAALLLLASLSSSSSRWCALELCFDGIVDLHGVLLHRRRRGRPFSPLFLFQLLFGL